MNHAIAQRFHETTDLVHDLIDELQSRGGIVQGNNIRGITCPKCGESEAFSFVDGPHLIHCPRENKCGEATRLKELRPELFRSLSELYPPTETDPKATARAYLYSRGLNPQNLNFLQETWSERKKLDDGTWKDLWNCQAIAFPCKWADDCRWLRLIDHPEGAKQKTRWKGENKGFRGQAWTSRDKVDPEKELWLTEGIFDTLSLEQVGLQSASCISASNIPTFFLERLERVQPIVIALDNDPAGHQGTSSLLKWLKERDFPNVEVAQPPSGKDWNDLNQGGYFNEHRFDGTINQAKWRGKLLIASSPSEYYEVLREQSNQPVQFFYWGGITWVGTERNGKVQNPVERVADCEIRLLFSLNDTTDELRNRQDFLLETDSKREGKQLVRLDAAELVRPTELSVTLLATTRQVLTVQPGHYRYFADFLLRNNPPKIRLLKSTGFDEKSGCFVFPKFAFDKNGKLHQPNLQGYYEQLCLMPVADSNAIKGLPAGTELVPEILDDHWKAFGVNGSISLGFQVASLFLHCTFPTLGFHPILSKVGDPNTGKTGGSKIENSMFGMDWSGVPMSKETTNNGLDRILAKNSGQVVFFNEAVDGKTNFSMDKLLTIFNREGVVKARRTNDLSTRIVEIKAALAFTWNNEMRASAPVKQRMVSLHYKNSEFNEYTLEAFHKLLARSAVELASVLRLLMQYRMEIEENFISTVLYFQRQLINAGVANERIAGCYAVCLAGFQTLMAISGLESQIVKERLKQLTESTTAMAKSKDPNESDETEDADVFLEAILGELQNSYDPSKLNENGFRVFKDQKTGEMRVAVHIETAASHLRKQMELIRDIPELKNQLKKHPWFKASGHSMVVMKKKKNVKAYIFEYRQEQELIGVESVESVEQPVESIY